MNLKELYPCILHRSDVHESGQVRGEDFSFVIVTSRWHATEVDDYMRNNRTLNGRHLDWKAPNLEQKSDVGTHGIECEAVDMHAATLIGKNLTIKGRPVSSPGERQSEQAKVERVRADETIQSSCSFEASTFA